MTDLPLSDFLDTARRAADAAAAVHKAHAGSVGIADAREKGRADYVSATDLAAQEACAAVIRESHPDHLIVAEESHEGEPDSIPREGPAWIVDPLDGTTNFLHGHPMHASSVALAIDGIPVVRFCPDKAIWNVPRLEFRLSKCRQGLLGAVLVFAQQEKHPRGCVEFRQQQEQAPKWSSPFHRFFPSTPSSRKPVQ